MPTTGKGHDDGGEAPGADPELSPEARIGAAMKSAREAGGLSRRAFAGHLYMSHSNLAEYENGHRLAPVHIVEAYERELRLAPGTLLYQWEEARVELYGEMRDRRPRWVDTAGPALKGVPEPAAASELAWEPVPDRSVPLPPFLTNLGQVFVGREPELERLQQLWREAEIGEVRVAFLPGEPGVGKTRLAAQLAHGAHRQGGTVLAGRCDEDLGVPYQPFVEALRHFLDHKEGQLAEQLGRYPGELTRLIPELAERVTGLPEPLQSDPETERYRLFDAVASWLTAISGDRPLMLILDDLQWAAKPTLLLLRHVVRFPGALKLLVIGTYRDSELGRSHPLSELLADLRRMPGIQRVSLSGLDPPSVAALLEQASGHRLDDDDLALSRAIHEETEGNPFFVWEVLSHLRETRAEYHRDGRRVTGLQLEEVGIPEGVREVVGRRVSRLSPTANRALSAAAVAGAEFELAVVELAAGIPGDDLVAALDEAEAARLLVDVPGRVIRYRFAHRLVRDTLYSELSAARRMSVHRRMAEAIESVHAGDLDDHLPALAHHFVRAATPAAGADKAVEYATRAGDRAQAQLAHHEAVAYYRQALDLLAGGAGPRDEAWRLELLIGLGEAERCAGDPAYRKTLLDAAHLARERGDSDALSRAALANNRGFFSVASGVDTERVAVLEAAVEAVGPADSGARARLLANLAVELVWAPHPERRQQFSAEALAIARRLGDPAVLGHVLTMRYLVLVPTVESSELRACITELDLAASLNDPALAFWAAVMGSMFAILSGDAASLDRRLGAADRLASDLGQPFLRWVITFLQSCQRRIAGQLDAAEALARESLELGTALGIPDAFRLYGLSLFWIRYDQGHLEEFADLLGRAVKGEAPDPFAEAALALTLCELDRHAEARPVFESLVASDFGQIPPNYAWLYGLSMAAESCACLGDGERASVLYDNLAPHHALVATPGGAASGSVAHYLGMLATSMERHAAANEHFAAAAETDIRLHAPAWLARTHLEWARMLLARRQPGDADRGRELLGQALATARRLGLSTVERRAVALLA